MIIYAAKSACGSRHTRNDDRILAVGSVLTGAEEPGSEAAQSGTCDDRKTMVAVFDGVSGSSRGDFAALAAAGSLQRSLPNEGLSLNQRLELCARETFAIQSRLPSDQRGCTAGAGMEIEVTPDGVFFIPFNVGDCRVYGMRDHILGRLTVDHSLAEQFRKAHGEDAQVPARIAHVITRAIGDKSDGLDMGPKYPCQDGDVFLVCSDGLWEYVPDQEKADIIGNCLPATEESLAKALDTMVRKAQQNGSPDDVSAVLVAWVD